MRVLQSSIYSNFLRDQVSAKEKINSLSTQLSSGKKISKSYEDSSIYTQTLRIDSEISYHNSLQDRVQKSKVLTDSADSALSSISDSLRDIKTKLIQASNDTINDEGLKSIAIEIENQKSNIIRLANSKVNGQYIFAGTAVDVKPFGDDGRYFGNDKELNVLIDKNTRAPYSISGSEVFYGIDLTNKKSVTSNVVLKNRDPSSIDFGKKVTLDTTIKELTAEDSEIFFYLKGRSHDGEIFKEKFSLTQGDKLSDLIDRIQNSYGDSVKVSLNDNGTIRVEDLKKGNSSLDFWMVASSESVDRVSNLNNKLEFNLSNYDFAKDGADDSAYFIKEGERLVSNIALFDGDIYANDSTKLSTLANGSLDGVEFVMDVTDVEGVNKSVKINLSDNSTFTIGSQTFNIYNGTPDVNSSNAVNTKADEFTMGQLNSIIALAMSGESIASNTKEDIDTAIAKAKESVKVSINRDGVLEIEDRSNRHNDIKFSIYDSSSDDFTKSGGSIEFMSNGAVIERDSRVDIFRDLDEIIEALKSGNRDVATSSLTDPKNIGIANSIDRLEKMYDHINNKQAHLGSISNNLQTVYDRSATLELNLNEFKSKVSDVDIAEVAIEYQQISLNYQAMMSTIAKVNSLSLLNFLK
jgi:flagellar hook-associated protein 3 FlgL